MIGDIVLSSKHQIITNRLIASLWLPNGYPEHEEVSSGNLVFVTAEHVDLPPLGAYDYDDQHVINGEHFVNLSISCSDYSKIVRWVFTFIDTINWPLRKLYDGVSFRDMARSYIAMPRQAEIPILESRISIVRKSNDVLYFGS